jgi:hypothetical protein
VGRYAPHYLDYVLSHEGLATRELYLGDAEPSGYDYGGLYLVCGELGAGVVFSFLVAEETVEVAALGEAYPEAVYGPAVGVYEVLVQVLFASISCYAVAINCYAWRTISPFYGRRFYLPTDPLCTGKHVE